MSLAQLTAWCDARFGAHPVEADARERAYDIPWVVMDNTPLERHFGWQPDTPVSTVLDEIAAHAESNPDWLERSGM